MAIAIVASVIIFGGRFIASVTQRLEIHDATAITKMTLTHFPNDLTGLLDEDCAGYRRQCSSVVWERPDESGKADDDDRRMDNGKATSISEADQQTVCFSDAAKPGRCSIRSHTTHTGGIGESQHEGRTDPACPSARWEGDAMATGNIIKVVDVLRSHIESSPTASMKPRMSFDGRVPKHPTILFIRGAAHTSQRKCELIHRRKARLSWP